MITNHIHLSLYYLKLGDVILRLLSMHIACMLLCDHMYMQALNNNDDNYGIYMALYQFIQTITVL